MHVISSQDSDIERAAAALATGALVAFPTETVYGLGADAFNPQALARIFEAKGRPRFDPLIIHFAELETLSRIIDLDTLDKNSRERLAILSEKLWPGPLTLILPKRREVPDLATAGLSTAAVRWPLHPVAQKLIQFSGCPVAAPSANLFGQLSPTRAEHVKDQLGEGVDFIIDGGRTQVGLESTVLDLTPKVPRILRPGGTSKEAIEALIGAVDLSLAPLPEPSAEAEGRGSPPGTEERSQLSPGQLKKHYAPRTPLVLYRQGELASLPRAPNEGRLYFSPNGEKREKVAANAAEGRSESGGENGTRVLSETGNLAEAAANLFQMLHELDSMGLTLIRAEEAPPTGLGVAINDRLRRAESGKTPGKN